VLHAGEQRAGARAVAPADVRDAVRVDVGASLEEVDRPPQLHDRLGGEVALLAEPLQAGGDRLGRACLGRIERQPDRAARSEPARRREKLGPVAAGPVHVDDGRPAALDRR
jgi:hypothetical protein